MNLHEIVEDFARLSSHTDRYQGDNIQIINDIKPGLRIVAGGEILSQTLRTVLELSTANGQPCYINVTAKLFNQLILVQIKTNLRFDYLVNEHRFRKINEMAGCLGGCLYISHDRKHEITISYTHLNQPKHHTGKGNSGAFTQQDHW